MLHTPLSLVALFDIASIKDLGRLTQALAAGAASTPVFGVLRKMTTASIANRLNWTAYRDLGVNPFQALTAAPGATPGAKRDNVVMGAPQPTLDSFFKKKPRTG